MNSCQINISTTFLGCFHPTYVCHGGICLKWVAFSQAFISNQLTRLVWMQLYTLPCGTSINTAEPAEMGRLRQHLRHYPPKCLGRDVSRRSCSLPWCQNNVLTFSKKQNQNPAALILPFPLKSRRSPGYSHSVHLVLHQVL